jgi:hypothetical protein
MINEAFIVGSSLYTMSLQMLVAKAVLEDRNQYARILPNNVNEAKNFKQNPTVKGMKPNRDYYIRQWGIDPIEIQAFAIACRA